MFRKLSSSDDDDSYTWMEVKKEARSDDNSSAVDGDK